MKGRGMKTPKEQDDERDAALRAKVTAARRAAGMPNPYETVTPIKKRDGGITISADDRIIYQDAVIGRMIGNTGITVSTINSHAFDQAAERNVTVDNLLSVFKNTGVIYPEASYNGDLTRKVYAKDSGFGIIVGVKTGKIKTILN